MTDQQHTESLLALREALLAFRTDRNPTTRRRVEAAKVAAAAAAEAAGVCRLTDLKSQTPSIRPRDVDPLMNATLEILAVDGRPLVDHALEIVRDALERLRPGESSMKLSNRAQAMLQWLQAQYILAGYPNHKVWTFSPAETDRKTFAELRAAGYLSTIGAGEHEWTLTDAGQRALMSLPPQGDPEFISETGGGTDRAVSEVPMNPIASSLPDSKKVFIIHGRNVEARKQMGIFLRALGLEPVNFDDLRASLKGTPTIAEIVSEGMRRAQGVVAIFTPDEYAALQPNLRAGDEGEMIERWQARPNVIFEAGMAFGRDRDRVVFVKFGKVSLFTDVAGVHILSPTNDPKGHRSTLRSTLKSIGCAVNLEASDWMHDGDFEAPMKGLPEVSPVDPFRGQGNAAPTAAGG